MQQQHYQITSGHHDETTNIATLRGPAGEDLEKLLGEFFQTYQIVPSLYALRQIMQAQPATVKIGKIEYTTQISDIPDRVLRERLQQLRDEAERRLHRDNIHGRGWLDYFVSWLVAKRGYERLDVEEVNLTLE